MLAAAGITELPVYARPRVAIVSTGDELVPRRRARRAPAPGQVRDSSAPALAALVREAGGEPALRRHRARRPRGAAQRSAPSSRGLTPLGGFG